MPRARAKNMQVESGSSSTHPAWAVAFGLPAAEPEDLRPPRPTSRLARASHFQAVRGQRLHGTWRPREHSCWHPSPPQGRSHPAPPLFRASDRSGALLAARPRTRELRAKKSKIRGLKRRQTDDFFHPYPHSERIQTDALGLAACDEARPAKVQKSFALPELTLCNGVPC